jgi:hypothetical protein
MRKAALRVRSSAFSCRLISHELTMLQVPKQNKEIIGGKHKNKEASGMGHSMGRVHMQKQDLNTMNLMKFKVISVQFFFARLFYLAIAPSPVIITLTPLSGHQAQDVSRSPLWRRCGARRRSRGIWS